ncbi:MAG: gamma-glutamyltransferase family protein [Chloroflexi bacterium]|nr:gamma-glutamyltransferase family protein [Chloroflexota bacterium]
MQFDYEFRSRRSNVIAQNGMVASSQPLASLAGLDVLRAGGTAADAAVAVAAMLTVVEPFSTGIGGDCFVLYWDASTKTVSALNGSGPTAKSANLDELIAAGYEQHPLFTGHAVSVPGAVGAWDALLRRFGQLSLGDVLAPAIRYAAEGFPVTELIGSGWPLMVNRLLRINNDPTQPIHLQFPGPSQPSGNEFLIDGRPPRVGEMMKLTSLSETMRQIASEGRSYFYSGDFSQKACDHVQRYGGWLEPSDFADFDPEWVEPIYADYRGVRLYECPPNGQGLAAIMAAKMANEFDLSSMDFIERTHTLIECMRLGFLEALQWVADPYHVDIPYENLFSHAYLQERIKMIASERAIKNLPVKISPSGYETVYLSVVDGAGNACSLINSLYMGGGAGLVVPGTGVLLQNRAALFELDPAHPNVLAGGKRPYHTIIPGMLTKEGELFASFGVMGGFMQPQGHLQVLSNLVDLGHNPQQALDMPRFCLNVNDGVGVGAAEPGGEVFLEKGFDFSAMAALREKGHRISPIQGRQRQMFGGGQVIQRNIETGVLIGGSDPRKDGCALGW